MDLFDKLYQKAEEYSFNIQSILFHELPQEQRGLWKDEIEQAYREGAKWGFGQAQQRQLDVKGIQG